MAIMCCGYNPNKSLINTFTHDIGKVLDSFIGNDNFLIAVDLNSERTDGSMHDFCNSYNLHSLCHKSTCYKNLEKPSCIDLFLRISLKSFQNTQTIKTGLSDFHKSVVTILKCICQITSQKLSLTETVKTLITVVFLKSCCLRLRNLDH